MRYLFKFTKNGNIKYISHLDMVRLFQRALKRADIVIQYSQGFSPHPKMSVAQPLSLGHESTGEYLEIDTVKELDCEELKSKLADTMPIGVEILSCTRLVETKKSASALVSLSQYEIIFSLDNIIGEKELKKAVEDFNKSEHCIIEKLQRKTGKTVSIDIKEFVHSLTISDSPKNNREGELSIYAVINTGSMSHLNPDQFMTGFLSYLPEAGKNSSFEIIRREMYLKNEKNEAIPLCNLI